MKPESLNSTQNGLEKAYSSQVHLEHRPQGDVVIKSVDAKERKNEIYFHEQMRKAGLPTMHVTEEGENLVLDFIENAETLGDKETPENYRSLGEIVRDMHHIKFDHPLYMDEDGNKLDISWEGFIQSRIERQHKQAGFDEPTINRAIEIIEKSGISNPSNTALLHGDLHANNALLKDGRIILFDKGDQIISGDPMYDLSLITINLPGAIFNLGDEIERDKSLLESFIEGYGYDFTENREKLNAYVLLRSLERWPNPFEKEIPDIVKRILNKKTQER